MAYRPRCGNVVRNIPDRIDIDYHIFKKIRKQLPKGIMFKDSKTALFLEHCKDYVLYLYMNELVTESEMDDIVARLHKKVIASLCYTKEARESLGMQKRVRKYRIREKMEKELKLKQEINDKPEYIDNEGKD